MLGGRILEALLSRFRRHPIRPVSADWKCPGKPRPHPVRLVHLEWLHEVRDDVVNLHRCRTCGTVYHCRQSEVNDWGSSGGDYSDTTRLWRRIEKDELRAARADPYFVPRSEIEFRHDSGWRREG